MEHLPQKVGTLSVRIYGILKLYTAIQIDENYPYCWNDAYHYPPLFQKEKGEIVELSQSLRIELGNYGIAHTFVRYPFWRKKGDCVIVSAYSSICSSMKFSIQLSIPQLTDNVTLQPLGWFTGNKMY